MVDFTDSIDYELETVFDIKIIDVQYLKDGIKNLSGMDKPRFCSKYFKSIYPILNIETSPNTEDEELYLNNLWVRHYVDSLILHLIITHDMYELTLKSAEAQLEMAERKRLTGNPFKIANPYNFGI